MQSTSMDELPRQKLRDIITTYGRAVCDDPKQCEDLLREQCGEHRREVTLLIHALEENITTTLLDLYRQLPHDVATEQCIRALQDRLSLTEEAARWVVESWALALGVVPDTYPAALQPATAVPVYGPLKKYTCAILQSVAFSPSGYMMASGSYDGKIRVWDMASGQQLRKLKGHTEGGVNSLVFSPDGRLLASGANDNSVRLWDVASGRQLRKLKGHGWVMGAVSNIKFSPDGRVLAASNYIEPNIRLWDVSTGQELRLLPNGDSRAYSIDFSPDGCLLASTLAGQIRLYDRERGYDVQWLKGHTKTIFSIDFSPDGRLIASGSEDHTLRVWDVASGRELWCQEEGTGHVYSVEFSPDGRFLISGHGDGTVRLWMVADGRELRRLMVHPKSVQRVSLSGDGRLVASPLGWEKSIWIWGVALPESDWQHIEQQWQVTWRNDGCCEVCGQRLSDWDRFRGFKRCKLHR